ncbi:syndetin-like [Corticium candelabrum]|uniref:syndetin-like n=1 Tax=Corticium candelabrum TaxID=121492 RepID=UPI002E261946|nr:syndetin-like [Corticium candelabrum]
MRMFLENDAWQLCPVRSTFSIMQLHEFRFLRPAVDSRVKLGDLALNKGGDGSPDFFTRYAYHGNPFDETTEEEEEEIMSNEIDGMLNVDKRQSYYDEDDDDDIADELKKDFVDEQTGEQPIFRRSSKTLSAQRIVRRQSYEIRGPIITNTTLMILRYFGKYMQMMNVLKPIAFDVLTYMSQLFDFYLFTVYSFFAVDRNDGNHFGLSPHITNTLDRISDSLFISQGVVTTPSDDVKVVQPCVSPLIDLSNANTLFGLSEREVAVESLVFLAQQFEFLQPHLESLIPSAKRAFLAQFSSQTVSRAFELRQPVYRGVADRAINIDKILHMMSQVKWDIKEIMSQHSPYVDVTVQEMTLFKERLQAAERRVPIPQTATDMMWRHCIRLVNRMFVEGFSSAKKCSNEGRALMQLDFQQFLVKLETLTNIRPIPDKQHVETYVKAYYIGENDLEQWLRNHKEYSTKQLQSLVTSGIGAHLSKKSKQRLLSVVDEIEKLKR